MARSQTRPTMRAVIIDGAREISVQDRPTGRRRADRCRRSRRADMRLCGGDLWQYRGESLFEPGPIGHELIGRVEEVGGTVRGIDKGDLVIAPTAYGDGICPNCRAGIANDVPAQHRAARRRRPAKNGRAEAPKLLPKHDR